MLYWWPQQATTPSGTTTGILSLPASPMQMPQWIIRIQWQSENESKVKVGLTCRKPPAEPPWMEASPPGPGEEVLREKKLLKAPLPPLLKNPLHRGASPHQSSWLTLASRCRTFTRAIRRKA